MSEAPATNHGSGWTDVWWDVLAFAAGLATAWYLHWRTTDLVWSLWLSSLVVGYAMIVWFIFGPVVVIVRHAWGGGAPIAQEAAVTGITAFGGVLLLGFFTFHFGLFHFVHSVFLNGFFPVAKTKGFPGPALYLEVLRRYWYFLPIAALAERQAFRTSPAFADGPVGPGAVGQRLNRLGRSSDMMMPYRNVIRMHLLIFFFAFVHFAGLDNFAVYAVVYAVYFFPWRLVRRARPAALAG